MLYPYDNTKVTVELRELIENGIDIWNFEYPSYYEGEKKTEFEKKVIDHYLFRQIGQETPARFMHYFRTRIKEIMPYYIQLYKSAELMNDPSIKPLDNYSMVEEYEETSETSGTSTGMTVHESDSESLVSNSGEVTEIGLEKDTESLNSKTSKENTSSEVKTSEKSMLTSDTPQSNIIRPSDADHYLTGAARDYNDESASAEASESINIEDTKSNTKDVDKTVTNLDNTSSESSSAGSSETTSEGSTTGTTTHRLTRSGNIGVTTYAQMLEGYRQTFLNIDMMIIKELNDLFLGVY